MNEVKGKEVAKEYNLEWYKNYEELLGQVDAVVIAVPTIFHKEIVLSCIEADLHILVEKPICNTFNDYLEIMEKINQGYNKIISVGHIERHNEVYKFALKKLNSGEWGDLSSLHSRRMSPFPQRITDVGVILDTAIHDIDLMCDLNSNSPKKVFAASSKLNNQKHEDNAIINLYFPGEIIASCSANWLSPVRVRDFLITTTTHSAELNFLENTVLINSNSNTPELVTLESRESLENELTDFLTSITYSKEPLVTIEEAGLAIKIVEACINSSLESKIIEIK